MALILDANCLLEVGMNNDPEHQMEPLAALVKKSGWVRPAPLAQVAPVRGTAAIVRWLPSLAVAGLALFMVPALLPQSPPVSDPAEVFELQSLPAVPESCTPQDKTKPVVPQPEPQVTEPPKEDPC